jgi:hypothetical protein
MDSENNNGIWVDVDWINFSYDQVQLRAFVNMLMNFRIL